MRYLVVPYGCGNPKPLRIFDECSIASHEIESTTLNYENKHANCIVLAYPEAGLSVANTWKLIDKFLSEHSDDDRDLYILTANPDVVSTFLFEMDADDGLDGVLVAVDSSYLDKFKKEARILRKIKEKDGVYLFEVDPESISWRILDCLYEMNCKALAPQDGEEVSNSD